MDQKLRMRLLQDPPKFHFWNDKPQAGGFGPDTLEMIARNIKPGAKVLETGAGLSTVWLLGLGAELESFFIDPELGEKIAAFSKEFDLDKKWMPKVGPSEITLPLHVAGAKDAYADMCIIDGGHGLSTVFTDFTYCNYVLKDGGVMVVDDLQLGSCQLLYQLLIRGWHCNEIERTQKTSFLRKKSTFRILPDFGHQIELLDKISAALKD